MVQGSEDPWQLLEHPGSEPLPTDLSELLKEGTKESHDRAENTQFVKDFLKGRIKKELFKLATVALYFTYSALEEEMDRNKDNPVFAPLYFPLELHRREALVKDLKYFYGEDWKEKIQCSEATQHYVDRIHHVGQHEPELLVAHAYTRYMGDLSGGQVLKKVAQRALKLPSTEEGIQFYVFDNISNAQQFKQLYRARMNALDLDKNTKERIVEEANQAFRFNMQVRTPLKPQHVAAVTTGLPARHSERSSTRCLCGEGGGSSSYLLPRLFQEPGWKLPGSARFMHLLRPLAGI
uniref:heme oxygenase (biliverdin-producing) n=1 Tax=Falco tinnunculus TaxID=100819 RepID=A0A8C4V1W3_FALTI